MGQSQSSWSAPALEGLEQRMLLAANADWTVLVYLDGDNNLEQYALDDINQMESVGSTGPAVNGGVPGGVNMVVQVDTQTLSPKPGLAAGGTSRGLITKDGLPNTITSALTDLPTGDQNMADKGVLADFLNWGMTTYPADHYALVLWDHGGGIDGAVQDFTSNYQLMSIGDMTSAISGVEAAQGAKFDLIDFIACEMHTLEVDYQLKDLTQMVVSSQESEYGPATPMDTVMGDLSADPSMTAFDLGHSFVDRYAEFWDAWNTDPANIQIGNTYPVTMSSVDTAELNTMASAMDQLTTAYLKKDTDWNVISDALDPTAGKVATIGGNYADLKGLLSYINANATDPSIVAASNTALTAFNHLVVDNYASAGLDENGVSVYLPQLPPETVLDPVFTTDNLQFLTDAHWLSFVEAYEFPRPDLYVSNVASGFQVTNGDPNVVSFGSPLASSDPSADYQTFTIKNNGNADLTLSDPILPDGFVLVDMPAHVLSPGLSMNVVIGLSTDTPGHYGGTVQIDNNDLNDGTATYNGNDLSVGPGTFTFTVSGDVTSSGLITVSGPDGAITSGSPDFSYNFGSLTLGGPSAPVTFTLTNTDFNDLNIGTITVPAGYTLVGPALTTLGFNQSTTFTLQLDTSTVGEYAGQVVIANSDATHSLFTFGIDGAVAGANLVVDDATYTPGYYASGESLDLKLTVGNHGDVAIPAATNAQVAVHLSTDDIWGNDDDLTVYLRNISLPAIAPGADVTISQSLHLTLGGVSPGDYYVATQINGNETIAETLTDDNTTFSGSADITIYDSRYYTRLTNGQHVSFKDSSGDPVTINFSGAGHVDILTSNLKTGRLMAGDVREMLLGDTAGNTVLNVTAGGAGMTVGQITARNEVKSILARGVNLAPDVAGNLDGSLSVSGGCGQITLGNLASGSSIVIGQSLDITGMTVTLGRLADSTVTSDTPIKTFSAQEWLSQDFDNNDSLADALIAPSIGKLTTTRGRQYDKVQSQYDRAVYYGDATAQAKYLDSLHQYSSGDFQADVQTNALGSAGIAGSMGGAAWAINGDMHDLTVVGVADSSTIRTTGSIAKITVGQADGFDVLAGASLASAARHAAAAADFTNEGASIGSYTIKGKPSPVVNDLYFQNSNISAPSIGTVSLLNAKWDNALTPFGLWGEQITSVKYASKPYGVKWTYPWAAGSFFDLHDMKIQLL